MQRQEQECRRLCESKGWEITAVYEDDDRSAYSGKRRPQYEAMLDAVRDGKVTAIVAWHPDRLHRSPRELEDFIDLIEAHKVKVATVQAGIVDLTTPTGRMSARIVGAVARGESEHKSERAKLKHRQLAESGTWSGGGTRPFGFEPDRVTIRLTEAKLIREAVSRYLAGDSLHAIAGDWNQRGILTSTGRPWKTHVLRRMIGSARIAGWREHRGELVSKAAWSPIISLDQHHAVRAVLADPDRLKRRTTRRYLLTGYAFCGLCGEKLVARPTSDKRKKYVCAGGVNFTGCGRISGLAEPIDELIAGAVTRRLRDADLEHTLTPMTEDVRAEVDEIQTRLDDLAEMYATGDITRREWMTARESLGHRLSSLRATETVVVGRRATVADARALAAGEAGWDDLPIQRQRSVVELLVERIVVGPAVAGRNFFDPSRVEIVWRV